MENATTPLSNVQLEILKLYSTDMDTNELIELKKQLANFYAQKSIESADKIWREKKLTNDDMDKWLEEA